MNEQEEQKEIKKEEPKQQQPIKNKTNMYCPNCKEIIAKTGVSDLVKETHDFEGLEALQKIESWWIFKDMFHFENIGFTKIATKKNFRFLCCASCEKEIIGFCVEGEKKFYLSSDKVEYKK